MTRISPQPAHSPPTAMQGRVCVVTGANSGIGLETARGLAGLGAVVVLACRDPGRGSAAVEDVRSTTGSELVELQVLDLASLDSVRRAATETLERHREIHVLVNNAGVVARRRSETADGFETTFGVNHLGPFLLTTLLLDRLVASAPARVVTVSSIAHRFGWMRWDDLMSTRRYVGMLAYGQSKLANVLFTRELDRRLVGRRVTANCLHPGAVRTNLVHVPQVLAPLGRFLPGIRTPAQGAATSLYLATSPDVDGIGGLYFSDCRPSRPSSAALDDAAARRLWDVSEELVNAS